MKRSILMFLAGVALVIVLILIPTIFTEQPEGGKLTSKLVAPPPRPAAEITKPIDGADHSGKH